MSEPIIYLAPFQGITDHIYRSHFARHFGGIDAAFTPFIADVSMVRVHPSKLVDVFPELNDEVFTVPQFLSNIAEESVLLINTLAGLGYRQVNWNMGCPFPKVANKKRGSGMLPYSDMIKKLLNEIMPQITIELSIKLRLGYRQTDEIFQLIDIFNQYPIAELIIHTRTGKQMYKGETHPEVFAECLNRSTIPLVYNGDIFTRADFINLHEQFPQVSKWMIGRGALRDPFLPYTIKGLPLLPEAERKEKIINFHNDLYAAYQKLEKQKNFPISRLKGVMVYLQESFVDHEKPMKKVFKSRNPQEYLSAIHEVFTLPLIIPGQNPGKMGESQA